MGRCNNQRAQKRAEALKNTPARARFSAPPAHLRGRNKKKTAKNNVDTNKNDANTKKRPPNAQVITKISQRVNTSSQSASKSQDLRGVDIAKLQELTLSDESIAVVNTLLRELGIIASDELDDADESTDELSENKNGTESENESSIDGGGNGERTTVYSASRARYNEYEDDMEDYVPDETTTNTNVIIPQDETAWDGGEESNHPFSVVDEWKEDAVFCHLSQKLSFRPHDAARACQAVVTWPAAASEEENKNQASRLVHAMDWLCLHLKESELKDGFKRNPLFEKDDTIRIQSEPKTRFKAIPHPSISVAAVRTEDEWVQTTRLEERAVTFLPLGFQHAEILEVLKEHPDSDEVQIIRCLLEKLEHEVVASNSDNGEIIESDVDCTTEREMEQEALGAIFDSEFKIEQNDGSGSIRYEITLHPSLSSGSSVSLSIYLRESYPGRDLPLFLLNSQDLPWPFLRQMNLELIREAREMGIGIPVVFEVANFINENIADLLENFLKEERTKEFEQAQLLLRKEAGHSVDDDDETMGRRRRARKKAEAIAFVSPEEKQRMEQERQVRENERIEQIQSDTRYMRQNLADRAVLERETQKQREGATIAGRNAMNAAFLRGATVEEARSDCRRAKLDYCEFHGINPADIGIDISQIYADDPEDEQLDHFDEDFDDGDISHVRKATPTTTAFMERLRNVYLAAKGGGNSVCLNKPKGVTLSYAESNELPRPVPPATSEISTMTDHIVETQREQPWLVASEARVPVQGEISDKLEDLSLSADVQSKKLAVSQYLRKEFEDIHSGKGGTSSRAFRKIQEQRSRLPAFTMRADITRTIRENQITLIRGETGCGKTTQCPQLVLADMVERDCGAEANIIVTQPRRISAIGVAERISSELGEQVGKTCGYSIKLERKYSKKTRILLCTTGILLRRLQIDPDLASVSHIFIDEVHERDMLTDFLLIVLKKLAGRRRSLKIVLMSATVSAKTFADYFEEYGCAQVEIPGRAFPVKEYRLEDVLALTGYEVTEDSDYAIKESSAGLDPGRPSKSALRKRYYPRYNSKVIHSLSVVDESIANYELLADLLEHIVTTTDRGAILVFLPGMMEILKAIDEMRRKELFQTDRVVIYPLHSTLNTKEQTQVFDIPPEGVRKIVVSTNIAETSITIEDVVYVVDAGRVKENRRDEIKETPALVDCWVSRSSAKQRRGRAGRVQPGVAYHMYSSHTYDHVLSEYILPEILRVGVEGLTLQILVLDLGEPHKFLGEAIDPPSALAMRNALSLLEELGAVECKWRNALGNEEKCSDLEVSVELTALGFHLASLPVEPRIGKIMIYGCILGCVESALTLAAAMSSKNLFASSYENREASNEARENLAVEHSDLLTLLKVYTEFTTLRKGTAQNKFIREHFLNRSALFQIGELRKQYAKLLGEIGFLREQRAHSAGHKQEHNAHFMTKAILCAGLYPNIIVAPKSLLDGSAKQSVSECCFLSRRKGDVYLHPCTLLSSAALPLRERFFCFHEIVKTSKLFVRDCTGVSPFALLLFGGTLNLYHAQGVVTVDDWLRFRISTQAAVLVKHLRSQMERLLLMTIVSPDDDKIQHTDALIEAVKIVLQSSTAKVEPRNDGSEIVRPWLGQGNEQCQSVGGSESSCTPRGHGGRGRGRGRGRSRARGHGGRGRK